MRTLLATLVLISLTGCESVPGDEDFDITPSGKADGSGYTVLSFNKANNDTHLTAGLTCTEKTWCDVTVKFEVDGISAQALVAAYGISAPGQSLFVYPYAFMVQVEGAAGNPLLNDPIFVTLYGQRQADGSYKVTNTHALSIGGAVTLDGVLRLEGLHPQEKVRFKTYWVHNFLVAPMAGVPVEADLYLAASWN
jgi:hypothetical protein